jgi:hypothetical protein
VVRSRGNGQYRRADSWPWRNADEYFERLELEVNFEVLTVPFADPHPDGVSEILSAIFARSGGLSA